MNENVIQSFLSAIYLDLPFSLPVHLVVQSYSIDCKKWIFKIPHQSKPVMVNLLKSVFWKRKKLWSRAALIINYPIARKMAGTHHSLPICLDQSCPILATEQKNRTTTSVEISAVIRIIDFFLISPVVHYQQNKLFNSP